MSVYNAADYLAEAVSSILNQTYRDLEFIIINDGSTDHTREILESYSDQRILLLHQENAGLTKSLNRALSLARGEFIGRQDADDVSMPDRFQTQVQFLRDKPDVAMVGSSVKVIDTQGDELAFFNPPCDSDTIRHKLKSYNCFWHGSVLFRHSSIKAVGGYTEAFTTAQDYDLWLRFAQRYPLENLPTPLYAYRFNPNAVTFKRIISQQRLAQVARELAKARENGQPEDAVLQGLSTFLAAPLTGAEGKEIVQSYKPWCRLLLNKNKLDAARALMSAVFKYHPSFVFRTRFTFTKHLLSRSQLERVLENA